MLTAGRVLALQDAADAVFVHHAVAEYVVRLVLATREPAAYGLAELADTVDFGASPRATLGTAAAARALALLRGRDYVLPEDVRDVARRRRRAPAGAVVRRGGRRAWTRGRWCDRVLAAVPAPRVAPAREPTADAAMTGGPPAGPSSWTARTSSGSCAGWS